ncbi:MAG TPA: tRNA preQ1(34) S-adenosylmethionine ribosyltransferase-isomerase QueA [Polyangia bacterium]
MLARGSGKFLLTEDFDYALPDGLIATQPALHRDASRLLILSKDDGERNHCFFRDLPQNLRSRSLIVLNDTRVIPARLSAHKPSGGHVEVFLVEQVAGYSEGQTDKLAPGTWTENTSPREQCERGEVAERSEAGEGPPRFVPEGSRPRYWEERWRVLVRGLGHSPVGTRLTFAAPFAAEVRERGERGAAILSFTGTGQGGLLAAAEPVGEIPLPPYIEAARRRLAAQPGVDDRVRYQTVYARAPGAVAAPTAGLHFTSDLLARIEADGHEVVRITLHVGPGTFRPVTTSDPSRHHLDAERFEVSREAAASIRRAQEEGRPVVAVGTTVVRTLETLARRGPMEAATGATDLLILPGEGFRLVTDLITNFHLPRSSLLMLVSAFAGRERVLCAYRDAIERGYRFYSYGDAMFIRPGLLPS